MQPPVHPRFLPPPFGDSAECGCVILRDGRAAVVSIAQPEDREALRDFFERLSPESRRRRFSSIAPPDPGLIALFCNGSDPRSALTLVVRSSGKDGPSIIAAGSYVAKNQRTAEVALAVEDAFQNKGLATLLLKRLARLAVPNGFTHFWAVTDIDNRPMQRVLRESGFFVEGRLQGAQIEMDLSVVPREPIVACLPKVTGHTEQCEHVHEPRRTCAVSASRRYSLSNVKPGEFCEAEMLLTAGESSSGFSRSQGRNDP